MRSQRDQRARPPAHATGTVEFVPLADIADDETFRLRAGGDISQLATSIGRVGQLAPIELRPSPDAVSGGPRWQVVSGFRRLAAVRMLARERVLARLHGALTDQDAWDVAITAALLNEPLTAEELRALRQRLRALAVAPWADELIDEAMVRAPVDPEERERFHDFLNAVPAAADAAATTGEEEVEARISPPPLVTPPPSVPEQPPTIPPPSAQEQPPLIPEPPVLVPEPAASAGSERSPEAAADLPAPSTDGPEPPPAAASSGDGATGPALPAEDVVEVTPEELVHDLTARLYALNQDLVTAFEAWEDLPAEGRRVLVEQARYVAALLPFMEAKQ